MRDTGQYVLIFLILSLLVGITFLIFHTASCCLKKERWTFMVSYLELLLELLPNKLWKDRPIP